MATLYVPPTSQEVIIVPNVLVILYAIWNWFFTGFIGPQVDFPAEFVQMGVIGPDSISEWSDEVNSLPPCLEASIWLRSNETLLRRIHKRLKKLMYRCTRTDILQRRESIGGR